jgi:hypothetical protein
VRTWLGWVVGDVIDHVDWAGLRGIWGRRQREISVAAQLLQQRELVVEATPTSVRPSVVKRPVAVDEAEDRLSHSRSEQSMALRQDSDETTDSFAEGMCAFAVMVEMHLDVGYTRSGHLCERFK